MMVSEEVQTNLVSSFKKTPEVDIVPTEGKN